MSLFSNLFSSQGYVSMLIIFTKIACISMPATSKKLLPEKFYLPVILTKTYSFNIYFNKNKYKTGRKIYSISDRS